MAMELQQLPSSSSLEHQKTIPYFSSGANEPKPTLAQSFLFRCRSKQAAPRTKMVVIASAPVHSIRALTLKPRASASLVGGDPDNLFKVGEQSLDDIQSQEQFPTNKLNQKEVMDLFNSNCIVSLQYLKQAHALVLKSGHFQDHYVSGTLLKCYADAPIRELDLALQVFDNVSNPNVFVFNIVFKCCLAHGEPYKVIWFYYKMVVANSRPNKFTYPPLFKACKNAGALKEGEQVHAQVVKRGLSEDDHIRSSGIQMYASFRRVAEARKLLGESEEMDVICCNAMIDGYMKSGNVTAAEDLFYRMMSKNVGSYNAMISGFCRLGMIKEARILFDKMIERDEITWSAMIDGYILGSYHREALEIFNKMQKEKIKPKKFVLSSVLAACANFAALDHGRWIHAYVKRNSIYLDSVLGTALLDMYVKCGRLDLAWEVFENMREKEVFTYNAMIGGLGAYGRAEDAIGLFSKMVREKIRPNSITFVGVLNACSHAGLVDKGLQIFHSMERFYGIEPQIEHYGCLVDLLGRAGQLLEAEQVINMMPMKPNIAVWGALLNACRIHGDARLGERVGNIVLDMDPENSGRYALLSNIYAKANRWDDVANLRKLMKERGIKTVTGCSMIDLNGMVHEFKMGDGSHPQMKEIYRTLGKVMDKLKTEGYAPNTSQVLLDIEEEEKETSVKYHSEKLAICFGILNTKPGTTIRVVKNLRVCEDCHSATKVISKVYDREIIVRDRIRYHHFKNGRCSCNDFW
ncbi:hypothetical protein ACFE04_026964 [Oxalis oulophora]